MVRSWQCQSRFKTRSGQVHGEVKERIRQGKSKVKARSRGKFNNSNSFNVYQINFYRPQLTPYGENAHEGVPAVTGTIKDWCESLIFYQ